MSLTFQAVGWNRTKRRYDGVVALGVTLVFLTCLICLAWFLPQATIETVLIRSLGITAVLMLHVILSIGPLCRLEPRFLPLLYNRRHLGVTLFMVALGHGMLSLLQFHALGNEHPLVSLLTTSPGVGQPSTFPFQVLGAGALLILFLMAATSHDFWLRTLTPPVWKGLHMSVYLAYIAVVMHVALGVLQTERDARLVLLLGSGVAWVVGLHLVAAFRGRRLDRESHGAQDAAFVDVCGVDEIPEGRAKTVVVAGERVAVFRYDGVISALSNVCQHQNGPLGEGRIRNGCVVCPWHGYEYLPHSGASPAPFTEKVPTFRVRVERGRVLMDPKPFPPGTPQNPARIDGSQPTMAVSAAPSRAGRDEPATAQAATQAAAQAADTSTEAAYAR